MLLAVQGLASAGLQACVASCAAGKAEPGSLPSLEHADGRTLAHSSRPCIFVCVGPVIVCVGPMALHIEKESTPYPFVSYQQPASVGLHL